MYGVLEVDEGYSGMSNDEVVPIQVSVGNPQLDPRNGDTSTVGWHASSNFSMVTFYYFY